MTTHARVACPTEHEEAVAFMQGARLLCLAQRPRLPPPIHITNETKGTHGYALVAYLKAEGREPGVPDYFWPVARGGFHGVWIELKRVRGGRLTAEQRWWGTVLREQGYLWLCCKGADQALEWMQKILSWGFVDVVGEDRRRLCGSPEDRRGAGDRGVVAAPGALLREPQPD